MEIRWTIGNKDTDGNKGYDAIVSLSINEINKNLNKSYDTINYFPTEWCIDEPDVKMPNWKLGVELKAPQLSVENNETNNLVLNINCNKNKLDASKIEVYKYDEDGDPCYKYVLDTNGKKIPIKGGYLFKIRLKDEEKIDRKDYFAIDLQDVSFKVIGRANNHIHKTTKDSSIDEYLTMQSLFIDMTKLNHISSVLSGKESRSTGEIVEDIGTIILRKLKSSKKELLITGYKVYKPDLTQGVFKPIYVDWKFFNENEKKKQALNYHLMLQGAETIPGESVYLDESILEDNVDAKLVLSYKSIFNKVLVPVIKKILDLNEATDYGIEYNSNNVVIGKRRDIEWHHGTFKNGIKFTFEKDYILANFEVNDVFERKATHEKPYQEQITKRWVFPPKFLDSHHVDVSWEFKFIAKLNPDNTITMEIEKDKKIEFSNYKKNWFETTFSSLLNHSIDENMERDIKHSLKNILGNEISSLIENIQLPGNGVYSFTDDISFEKFGLNIGIKSIK